MHLQQVRWRNVTTDSGKWISFTNSYSEIKIGLYPYKCCHMKDLSLCLIYQTCYTFVIFVILRNKPTCYSYMAMTIERWKIVFLYNCLSSVGTVPYVRSSSETQVLGIVVSSISGYLGYNKLGKWLQRDSWSSKDFWKESKIWAISQDQVLVSWTTLS